VELALARAHTLGPAALVVIAGSVYLAGEVIPQLR